MWRYIETFFVGIFRSAILSVVVVVVGNKIVRTGLRDALDDFYQIGCHAHGCDCAAGPEWGELCTLVL